MHEWHVARRAGASFLVAADWAPYAPDVQAQLRRAGARVTLPVWLAGADAAAAERRVVDLVGLLDYVSKQAGGQLNNTNAAISRWHQSCYACQ